MMEAMVADQDKRAQDLAGKITEALEPIWAEYEWIGLRFQSKIEAARTKVGCKLRPSHEWIDNRKTRRKMVGTAAFHIDSLSRIELIAKTATRYGYYRSDGERFVLIGSNDGVNVEDMPERYAGAFKNAVLLAVL